MLKKQRIKGRLVDVPIPITVHHGRLIALHWITQAASLRSDPIGRSLYIEINNVLEKKSPLIRRRKELYKTAYNVRGLLRRMPNKKLKY